MSVILITVGLVFGAYLYQPMWFDHGPYTYVSSHESLADCQRAKTSGTDEVFMQETLCANGELYMKEVGSGVSKTHHLIKKPDSTDTTMKSHWNE